MRARYRRVAAVLSVTRIIDKKERVAARRIFAENCRPIERERTIAAKRNPKPFRHRMNSRNVIRHIFRGRDGVINFQPVGRQRVDVALVVRTRMVNQRMLPKIEDRQHDQKDNEKSDDEPDYFSRPIAR